jgi:hypothetical protein
LVVLTTASRQFSLVRSAAILAVFAPNRREANGPLRRTSRMPNGN